MSNIRDIYNDLLEQYNKLEDDEKRAIVVYKSKLFRLINRGESGGRGNYFI